MQHNPVVVLIIGLLFYAGAIFGAATGTFGPNPEHKILSFVLECIPAMAILVSAILVRIPVILAALLAVAGPIVLAIVTF